MAEDLTLDALCEAYGLALSFDDAAGVRQHANESGKRAVLQALGVDLSPDGVENSLAEAQVRKSRPVPLVVVCEAGAAFAIPVAAEPGAEWALRLEDGGRRTGAVARDGVVALPPLPQGYHVLHLREGGLEFVSTLLCAPPQCYLPDVLAAGARRWGVTAQVYGLRGAHDLGIGTYRDVGTLAAAAGARGAAFLGLSPLHALFGSDPSKYSPYSPSSRMFLQTGLIDLGGVAGAEELAASMPGDAPTPGPFVDYGAVLPFKQAVLEALWANGARERDHAAVGAFRRAGGELLERHATFEALSEHFKAQGMHWVGAWPAPYRDARSPEVAAFARDHGERLDLQVWLQWLADRQLAEASTCARDGGMEVGLYRDLAVGADRAGSEVWGDPTRFVGGLSVGAPPDLLGPAGQDWGLPPLDPIALEESGLKAFRDLVAANMRHAGAVRIDHAFQLQRLYVLPLGGAARDGVYLAYPFEAMLAVLRIESHRARCAVIAEDLGTAPKGFSDAIMASGLLSYRVVPFERGPGGTFLEPSAYPRSALSALATHDLPTLLGWWRGLDVDLREGFGFQTAAQAAGARAEREHDRGRLKEALAAEELPTETERPDAPPTGSILRFLARTEAALAAVQMEDVFGEAQQANLPGPDRGHPNWRRRSSVTVEEVATGHNAFDRAAATFRAEGRTQDANRSSTRPRATYRLQLHKDFTFDDAAAVAPYLRRLGVSHVYTSSIQTARPSSTHGYDVVDPARLNPELGGEEGFARFSDALRANGLRLLVDIVPNHMGVGGSTNPWWLDVLEWGRLSPHATSFDIDWEKPGADGKLVVPFLGSPLDECLEKDEVVLRFDAKDGRFAVWYADHRHPVSPLDYSVLLGRVDAAAFPALTAIARDFADLARLRDEGRPERLLARAGVLQRRLARLAQADEDLAAALDAMAAALPRDELRDLIARQFWRLLFWKDANAAINYRRFFDITSLAGIRMEDPRVFQEWHGKIFDLVRENRIHGLRVDHVDGLAAPSAYLRQLDAAVGPDFYTLVEKILEPGEDLPPWPVAGTTGYDALHTLDALFFAPEALPELDAIFAQVKRGVDEADLSLPAIRTALATQTFVSELDALLSDLRAVWPEGEGTGGQIRTALLALLARFPVYRVYGEDGPLSPQDRASLDAARQAAASTLDGEGRAALDRLVALLARDEPAAESEAGRRAQRRFQQLTGPLMAKSFEDTLFYRHARFIAANEVGCGPDEPGIGAPEFHDGNEKRATGWPGSMLATSTHDTKRGEDARGRLLAASHDMEGWKAAWNAFQDGVSNAGQAGAIDAVDLYFLFQSLIAAAPVGPSEEERAAFEARAKEFIVKSLREAKRHSTWIAPDETYENAAQDCVARAAAPDGVLFGALAPFIRAIAHEGARLGVARTVLKCTVPGVPDTYQGSELTDLSFVDPDNRRPVDYAGRAQRLEQAADPADEAQLLAGHVKLAVLSRLLADRERHPQSYDGPYRALPTSDDGQGVAFLRGDDLLVAARRTFGREAAETWRVSIPNGRWRNLLDGATLQGGCDLPSAQMFGTWPAIALRRIE